jgi:hypothetical protein
MATSKLPTVEMSTKSLNMSMMKNFYTIGPTRQLVAGMLNKDKDWFIFDVKILMSTF